MLEGCERVSGAGRFLLFTSSDNRLVIHRLDSEMGR